MNLVVAFLVVVLAVGVAVTAMLLVRRRAPEGSRFKDGDRASGVFGVIATGFSVLLGFIVFLAFTSYDSSRAGAEAEARTVAQQIQTAQFFDRATASELTGELVCYARWVAGPEWEAMEDGAVEEGANRWGATLFRTTRGIDPQSPVAQSAYDKWLDETSDRQDARQDRIHGAAGVIPTPLWIVLLAISVIVFTFMLFFADPGEGAVTQSILMGSVVAIITMLLLLLQFLDHPFAAGVGQLKPTEMERTLEIAASEIRVANIEVTIPCDSDGRPR
jgi:hypothetical protein